jgi:uncharacterized membrane protein YccC
VKLPRLNITDPGLTSLKTAARAAIVMPAVFALADQVIQQPQTAIFAAFGSFAMLVLADFGGRPRARFTAYLTLAVAGTILIVAGTLCSRNAWLAAAAMAAVGFLILFSGVINGYFAAGSTAAVLLFVLPVAIPAPAAAIPWRLAGWGIAAGAAICAAMLLWPPRIVATLRAEAARACLALAGLADCAVTGDTQASQARAAAATAAVGSLSKRFRGTQHRPGGPARATAALASLSDELGWLLESLVAVAGAEAAGRELCRDENGEAMAAAAAALRDGAAWLTGRRDPPGLGRLEAAQEAMVAALAGRISELPPSPDEPAIEALLGRSFRARAIAYTSQQIVGYAMVASGGVAPDWGGEALHEVRQFTVEHASARSVWFRNSVRGAAGLAIAVFIAQRSGLQHSFWVVLGTLSVLRSNALGTGRSIVSALAGTAAGILVGAAIIIPVGRHEAVLWAVLPVAVLVATYAPRAVSFAAGQAAFTVVILVLFNIIQPVGWKVGLIRIEDVAIGFAVSLGVGLVFWPRGAARLLRENISTAYSRTADYVAATAQRLAVSGDTGDPGPAGESAATAVHRLDDAFRQYLAERSAKNADPESVARLVAGAGRVLRAGRSMAALERMTAGHESTAPGGPIPDGPVPGGPVRHGAMRCGENLDREIQALRAWYVTLGDCVANGTSVPRPQDADTGGRRQLLECVRDCIASGREPERRGALVLLWVSQHLDTLRHLEAHLGRQAAAASGREN